MINKGLALGKGQPFFMPNFLHYVNTLRTKNRLILKIIVKMFVCCKYILLLANPLNN